MRRALLGLLLPSLLGVGILAGSSAGQATWELRSLPAGSATWIAARGSTVTMLGAFDGGSVWSRDPFDAEGRILSPGLPFPIGDVAGFSIGAERLVSLRDDGVVWTSRPGSEWETLDPVPQDRGMIVAIEVIESTIWAGTDAGWLLRNRLDGSGWESIHPFDDGAIRKIAMTGLAGGIVLLEDGRLFTQDTAWVAAPWQAEEVSFRAAIADPGLGYAIEMETHHLWRTENGGLGWTLLSTALAEGDLAGYAADARGFVLDANGIGVIPCGDALLTSADGGINWRVAASGSGLFLDADIVSLGVLNEILTAGPRIHRSVDGGSTVQQTMGGDFSEPVIGSPWILWALDRGLLLSIDGGDRWFRQALPDRADRLRRIAAQGDYTIWLHFEGPDGSRLYRSEDRGLAYERIDLEERLGAIHGWDFPETGVGWAYRDSTILRTTDAGTSWQIVHETGSAIEMMDAEDRHRAVFASDQEIFWTVDAGRSWSSVETPQELELEAIVASGVGSFIGVGAGIVRIEGNPPSSELLQVEGAETLRAVAMTPEGVGWAVGDRGTMIGTVDGGGSWQPFEADLELRSLELPLVGLDLLSSSRAVSGAGRHLLRLAPDATGPTFRVGISMNPHIPRYIDIHLTAGERLRGDSLTVTIDGVAIPTDQFDPEGYLFRARYRVPEAGVEREMVVRGRDWVGNESIDRRGLLTFALAEADPIHARWGGETVLVSAAAKCMAAFLQIPNDPWIAPDGWRPAGEPFRVTAGSDLILSVPDRDLRIARRIGGLWRVEETVDLEAQDDAELVLIRSSSAQADTRGPFNLRLFPNPARDRFTLDWENPVAATIEWELFDLGGRRLHHGITRTGERSLRLRPVDARGERLAAGVYWIEIRIGASSAARRLVVAR